MSQKQYKPHFEYLKNKWSDRQTYIQKSLWEKHKESLEWLHHKSKHLMVGSLSGLIMFSHPVTLASLPSIPPTPVAAATTSEPLGNKYFFIAELVESLPKKVDLLTPEQEQRLSTVILRYLHIPATAVLQGKRLNRSYGIIGAEQHLMRFPGDNDATHFTTDEEWKYRSSGLAPGRGAWGYFANSQAEMTEQDKLREKYYIAVQTFLAPGWNENVREYAEFFKYRKMLVINPENGKAMVVVIADAGPAEWTGKHLGGSPEVMSYLERQDGGAKGPVIYFFVDDPNDTIPLGPVTVK